MPAAHNHSGAPTKRVVPRSRCTHRFADDASRSLGSEDASSIVRHVREDDRERKEQEAQQEEPHETVALAARDACGPKRQRHPYAYGKNSHNHPACGRHRQDHARSLPPRPRWGSRSRRARWARSIVRRSGTLGHHPDRVKGRRQAIVGRPIVRLGPVTLRRDSGSTGLVSRRPPRVPDRSHPRPAVPPAHPVGSLGPSSSSSACGLRSLRHRSPGGGASPTTVRLEP